MPLFKSNLFIYLIILPRDNISMIPGALSPLFLYVYSQPNVLRVPMHLKAAAVNGYFEYNRCGRPYDRYPFFKLPEWAWFHPLHSAGWRLPPHALSFTFPALAGSSWNCQAPKSSERARRTEAMRENNWRHWWCVNCTKRSCVKVFVWPASACFQSFMEFPLCLSLHSSGSMLSARRTVWILE